MNRNRSVIPLFFAVDDAYAPFLAVALRSIVTHISDNYTYRVHVLVQELSGKHRESLLSMQTENLSIEFVDVREKLATVGQKFHLRDYYSLATYYRFFVPDMFPEYDRGLYLDSDIIVNEDIAHLFFTPLDNNLIAGAVEEVMTHVDVFGTYTEVVLGIPRNEYVNAGVLLMNLAALRRVQIEKRLLSMMRDYTFKVTQDQDYMNVLCRGHVAYFSTKWNRTAFTERVGEPLPSLAHFKINWKPWHYTGIAFEYAFWQYAKETPFYDALLAMRDGYTDAEKERDCVMYRDLAALAASDTAAARRDGYILPVTYSVAAEKCKTCKG